MESSHFPLLSYYVAIVISVITVSVDAVLLLSVLLSGNVIVNQRLNNWYSSVLTFPEYKFLHNTKNSVTDHVVVYVILISIKSNPTYCTLHQI